MKKSFLKFLFVTFLMTMLLGMGVLAAETETPENEEIVEEYETESSVEFTDVFTHIYVDQYNISSTVNVSARIVVTYSWDEYVGWIDSIHFYTPTITIDNQVVSATIGGSNIHSGDSTAYQIFNINNSSMYVKIVFVVDEYGDTDFYAEFN